MLTQQQRITRKQFIGSSDSAALLGCDPYRSAMDVYLSKVRDLDDFTNPRMEVGNRLEPILVDWASEQLGQTVTRNLLHIKGPLCANLDARLTDRNEIIEAKTTGITEGWGDEGTDAVPDRVLIQTHHAMHVTGAVVAWVPVIIGRFGLEFRLYRVARDERLCKIVAEQATAFFEDHVRPQIPPVGSVPSLEILKRIRREPETCADIDDTLIVDWENTKAIAKAAKEDAERTQAALINALGTAESGRTSTGQLVTYLVQHRKECVSKASTFRVLKLKGK